MENNVLNQDVSLTRREASAIMNAMGSGAVPKLGVQHVMVGRHREVEALDHILDSVGQGESSLRLWIGDFGSGKSFMLRLVRLMAHNRNFVVSDVMFDSKTRLHSTAGHAKALYVDIVKNISIKTKPDHNALQTLIELWIEQLQYRIAEEQGIDPDSLMEESSLEVMNDEIKKVVCSIEGVGDTNFAAVLMKYYEGWAKGDELLIENAMRWFNGDYSDKRDAKRDLGVTDIVNDDNYLKYLMLLSQLFVLAGYSGFVINMDECYSLYQIVGGARQSNYDVIRKLYDYCAEGKVSNLLINLAGTNEFLFDRKKGLYSYGALKTRLQVNPYAVEDLVDYRQPVFLLGPLNHESVSVLCEKLLNVFNVANDVQITLNINDIEAFMNECRTKRVNRFRDVIREFIDILNLMIQNPGTDFLDLCRRNIGQKPKGTEKTAPEEIEEI